MILKKCKTSMKISLNRKIMNWLMMLKSLRLVKQRNSTQKEVFKVVLMLRHQKQSFRKLISLTLLFQNMHLSEKLKNRVPLTQSTPHSMKRI